MSTPLDSIFNPDQPKPPDQVQLDPGSQGLINNQVETAKQDPSYYSGLINQGVDRSQSLNPNATQSSQEQSRLGNPNTNLDAIRAAYRFQAQSGIKQVYDQNSYQGQLMKADYMNKISSTLLGQQAQSVQSFQRLNQAYMDQEMGRAQTINSIFQVGNQAIVMNKKSGAGGGATAAGSNDGGIMVGGGGGALQTPATPYGAGDYNTSGSGGYV